MNDHTTLAAFIERYWHIATGLAAAFAAAVRVWWYQHRRITALEERIPPLHEGKMLATKQHVDECHGRVNDAAEKAHKDVMRAIDGVHERIDKLYELLLGRKDG